MTNNKKLNGENTPPRGIKFPCDFIVKVMGETDGEFETIALKIFKKHFPKLNDSYITKRYSKDNHYLSLTVHVYAENQAQLDALYQELSNEPSVLVAL